MDMVTKGMPDPIWELWRLHNAREIRIDKDGIGAVADEVGDLLSQIYPPSEEMTPLTGNFFFRHDGKGNYRIEHRCDACRYGISTGPKVPASLELFDFALEQGWLAYLAESLEVVH